MRRSTLKGAVLVFFVMTLLAFGIAFVVSVVAARCDTYTQGTDRVVFCKPVPW